MDQEQPDLREKKLGVGHLGPSGSAIMGIGPLSPLTAVD